MTRYLHAFVAVVVSTSTVGADEDTPNVRLFEWQRGFAVQALEPEDMVVYLWFYEWNMFEAIEPGQHTNGTYKLRRSLGKSGREGVISSDALTLRMTATTDGADLELTVHNRTDYDFPPIAAVIPCFNPGPAETRNRQFANTNTYFLGPEGLKKLVKREIHFNDGVRDLVDREAEEGRYAWSHKWPMGKTNAFGGLIVRESAGGKWVCGIAWEDFLSAQAHNPWECMHLSIRIGPLRRGESKTVRGKIYLFEGDKEELLKRYRADFGE
ncbi:MAG: hypothetical protein ACYTG0_27855 [Planctomycetota bacterium]|jgi:hypothetical protein